MYKKYRSTPPESQTRGLFICNVLVDPSSEKIDAAEPFRQSDDLLTLVVIVEESSTFADFEFASKKHSDEPAAAASSPACEIVKFFFNDRIEDLVIKGVDVILPDVNER